jgi:ABC-type lipoprotein release transport system permease subunit
VNDLFGLSMNYIMIGLLIVLGVALSTVGWVVARNRVLFVIGVRNIPRRRAQTTLIIIGLMLSTVIIATAFSIGDTVNYSITNQAYTGLAHIDETVQAATGDSSSDLFAGQSGVSAKPIPQGQADQFVDAFKTIDGVDGVVNVIRAPVPASNPRAGQTEPLAILVGVDGKNMAAFPDIESTDGRTLSVDDLRHDEIYANSSVADKLDIVKGDQITIFVGGGPNVFTVKEIVKDRVLSGSVAGSKKGFSLSLARAQELLKREGEVDFIAISNNGGVRDGVNGSAAVEKALNAKLQGTTWKAQATKQDFVDQANLTSSFLTTFFVVLGLFSIAAGMMLIFLIFVMLAAERRVEMGMMRAVGTKRLHLMETFLSEGMAYNVMAAAVGCGLGVAVSLGMVRVMAILFSQFGLSIVFNVSARSLIVSYSLGVVLTFLTVTFSSWRISNLNIVAAIRDMAESAPRQVRPSVKGLGGVAHYAVWLLFKPTSWRTWWTSMLVCIGGVLLLAVSGVFYVAGVSMYGTSPAASVGSVLLFIVGVLISAGALVIAFAGFFRIFQMGGLLLLLSAPLIALGLWAGQTFPFGVGVSFVIGGFALTAIQVGVQQRLVATTAGVVMLVMWLLFAGGRIFTNIGTGGIEMFFLSGVTMILSSTFVLVYNADILLGGLTLLGGVFSGLVPSIRTAIAYPMANKFRTGMTIAMISLVMFALVMMSTMNSNFNRIFLGDDALGGYQVAVTENPSNHIEDLKGALAAANYDGPGGMDALVGVDDIRVANRRSARVSNTGPACEPGADCAAPAAASKLDYQGYQLYGLTAPFIANNGIKFTSRAEGLSTDADVWKYVAEHPDAAVIDAFAVPSDGGGFGPGSGFMLEGVKQGDATFKPVTISVLNQAENIARNVRIVGVFTTKVSGLYNGLYLSPSLFDEVFAKPESSIHLVRLADGVDSKKAAHAIEKALLAQGAQADSLRQLVDDFQAANKGFLYLIQGFMGIGLFVGIAAVGVIAFRTVVERRQQIGMLRAIGYTRNAVAISFVMESSFVALLGVLSGIGLALLLAYQLLTSDDLGRQGIQGFYIPWMEIGAIGTFAFLASLLMTIIPSRQASSIPIAEALRYE